MGKKSMGTIPPIMCREGMGTMPPIEGKDDMENMPPSWVRRAWALCIHNGSGGHVSHNV